MVVLPTSCFTNILFGSIISNVLGQFPYFVLPDLWLERPRFKDVSHFLLSWLKEGGIYMCKARFIS